MMEDKLEKKPSRVKQKKRYLLRVLEQQEAEQEIKRYEDSETTGGPSRLDGGRPDSRQRRKGEFQ